MKRLLRAAGFLLSLVLLWGTPPAFAQLVSHPDAPVRVGHYHLNVTSIEAHKKFWVDTLGGTPMKFGNIDVVKFPDAFIFLRLRKPTGPTRGTAFDHIGFAVPNVPRDGDEARRGRLQGSHGTRTKARRPAGGDADRRDVERCMDGSRTSSARMARRSSSSLPPTRTRRRSWRTTFTSSTSSTSRCSGGVHECVWTPRCGPAGPTSSPAPTCLASATAWKLLSAGKAIKSITHVPTAGRVVDHVGFEVKNLEAFCKALEAKGIKLTRPVSERRAAMERALATAMIIDPWGVSIELTEGLDKIN